MSDPAGREPAFIGSGGPRPMNAGLAVGDPVERIDDVYRRIEADGRDGVRISLVPHEEARRRAVDLAREGPSGRPCAGGPFRARDNTPVAGTAPTAAYP